MTLSEIWDILSYLIELNIAAVLFAAGLKKRKWWGVRYAVTVVLTAGINICVDQMISEKIPMIICRYILLLIMTSLVLMAYCRISRKDAVYATLCAYALQHFASSLYILISQITGMEAFAQSWSDIRTWGLYFATYIVVYVLFYRLLIRKLSRQGEYNVDFRQSTEVVLLVIPIALVMSLIEKLYGRNDVGFIICQIYAMVCCFFVLWVQYWQRTSVRLKTEMMVQNCVMQTRKEQYQMSLANIDIINQKCHDLKYQIEMLKGNDNDSMREKAITEIAEAVQIYDMSRQTGNEVLDTVLMEKSLLCSKWGIQMTCLADGKTMEFMDPIDLYTVFGNAVDNAIEAVKSMDEPEKRVIAVSIFKKDKITILQVENYYEGEVIYEKDLPKTSKEDGNYHGFGLKSIRSTIEKYGGSMSVNTEDRIFILCVIFPGV